MPRMLTDRADWPLLVVRLVLGSCFLLHGLQLVFGWWGGRGLDGFAAAQAARGFPLLLGYLAALFVLLGGLMLLLGLCAELGALLVSPVMAVAAFRLHWGNGYFSQHKGYEYALNLLILCLLIAAAGPGPLALWDPLRAWRARRRRAAAVLAPQP